MKAEIFSYSRNRGLFAGVSLEGVVLSVSLDTNAVFAKDTSEGTWKAADGLKAGIALLSVDKLPSKPGPIRK